MSWQYLMQHLGHWRGSFTRLTPRGEIETDIPSLLTLDSLNGNQTVRLVLQYFDPKTDTKAAAVTYEKIQEFSAPMLGFPMFENGAFSQGSRYWSSVSEFAAELGFIHRDRRLRLVQQFRPGVPLPRLTLIREGREGTEAPERPPLTLDDLLGNWLGESTTVFADARSPLIAQTQLQLKQQGDILNLYLSYGSNFEFTSTAKIAGNILQFEQDQPPIQVLLLPDGASCTFPSSISAGRPFFLEAGWLIESNLRQRLIRNYNDKGEWVSLTLITERRK